VREAAQWDAGRDEMPERLTVFVSTLLHGLWAMEWRDRAEPRAVRSGLLWQRRPVQVLARVTWRAPRHLRGAQLFTENRSEHQEL